MPVIVRAFPVLAGKEQQLEKFARQLTGPKASEAARFYSSLGVASESWHLQPNAVGPLVIVVTELKTAKVDEKARAYAASERPFDRWFKDQVQCITGVSPDRDPLGPETFQLFEWRE